VGLSADLSRAALAIGPSPALQLSRERSAASLEEDQEDDDFATQEDEEEEDSAAQHMSEWDVEELERALDQMHRDVEWM